MNTLPDDSQPTELRAAIARLRDATALLQPPPALEAELRTRLFAAAPRTPHASVRRPRTAPALAERWAAWIAWPVSVAAATMLCSWMVFTYPGVAPAPVRAAGADAADNGATATPFLALTTLDDIPAGARNEVVSATLPRATLAEFGLPVSPMRAAEPINAEFLVGPNGSVLAVRFVDGAGQ